MGYALRSVLSDLDRATQTDLEIDPAVSIAEALSSSPFCSLSYFVFIVGRFTAEDAAQLRPELRGDRIVTVEVDEIATGHVVFDFLPQHLVFSPRRRTWGC